MPTIRGITFTVQQLKAVQRAKRALDCNFPQLVRKAFTHYLPQLGINFSDTPISAAISNRKISDQDIVTIRQRLARGELQRQIASDYGVTEGLISHIKVGRKRLQKPIAPTPHTHDPGGAARNKFDRMMYCWRLLIQGPLHYQTLVDLLDIDRSTVFRLLSDIGAEAMGDGRWRYVITDDEIQLARDILHQMEGL